MLKSDLKDAIGQIRERFTDPNNDPYPDLEELAGEYGLEVKLLKRIATAENWINLRNRKRDLHRKSIVRAENREIEIAAIDVGRARGKLFADQYNIVNTHLHEVMDEIFSRIPEMETKDLIAHGKTILDLGVKLQKMVDDLQDKLDTKNPQKGEDLLSNVVKGRIVDFIENKRESLSDEDVKEMDEKDVERDGVFEELDAVRKL